jgi:hypothetical protein
LAALVALTPVFLTVDAVVFDADEELDEEFEVAFDEAFDEAFAVFN